MDEEVMKEPELTETPAKHKLYSRFPDKEYADDMSLMDDADSEIESLRGYKGENEATNAELIAALENDPDLMALVAGAVNKIPARVTAARIWGPEGLTAEEGDPDFEEVTKAHQERIGKRGEEEKFLADLKQNIEDSQKAIDAFAEDNGMDEESRVSFLGNVTQVLTDAYNGKITPDFLARMYTAENHEKEVAAATENGVIEGKNAAIEEKLSTERNSKAGDGLPAITAGAAKVTPVQPKAMNPASRFLEGTGIG
jgi:hypothetical protein